MCPNPANPQTLPSALSVDLRRLSWAAPLICDYCHAFDRLAPFYTGTPATPAAWNAAIAAQQTPQAEPSRIATIVTAQLRARAAPAEALAAAEQLRQPGTVAILTGQQAGLFGGPLFTLLKALTAIALSRRVVADYGVRAVPVFWVDAEDHDLDEIRTCSLLDGNLELHQLSLDLPAGSSRPAASVPLPDSITQAIVEVGQLLPRTEFSDGTLERLAAAYSPGTSFVEAFSRWLDSVLGAHGLVVFDASDATAKPLVQSLFDRELRSPGETSRLAAGAGKELSARGYPAQVTPAADATSLFHVDGTRQPIRLSNDAFAVGDTTVPAEQLLDRVRSHPEAFSPNVLLRPIVQDTLFPTIAYVAGPHELAYLGQLRQAYAHFGVPMPLIYPRVSATLVDRATVKFLTRYKVEFETLQAQDDGVLNRLLSAQLPPALERALGDSERHIAAHLRAVEAEVPTIDPTLGGAVQTTRGRMERDLRNLRGKIVQAAKRRDDTLRRQFHRARAQAFPAGDPQERAVAFIYFLNRYGPSLVEQLLATLPLDMGKHWLLTV